MVRQARELQPVRNRLIIELLKKPNIKPKEYIKILLTPKPKDI